MNPPLPLQEGESCCIGTESHTSRSLSHGMVEHESYTCDDGGGHTLADTPPLKGAKGMLTPAEPRIAEAWPYGKCSTHGRYSPPRRGRGGFYAWQILPWFPASLETRTTTCHESETRASACFFFSITNQRFSQDLVAPGGPASVCTHAPSLYL